VLEKSEQVPNVRDTTKWEVKERKKERKRGLKQAPAGIKERTCTTRTKGILDQIIPSCTHRLLHHNSFLFSLLLFFFFSISLGLFNFPCAHDTVHAHALSHMHTQTLLL
jgi:hypothetical protein